ncbi:MAG: nucleotidyltransferase family protein, partial [Bacilli bacterium]|nr:nucleotidyltransferase family protein [Bacilli bacterium]
MITQEYTSSTSIRKYLEEGKDIQNISEYISKNTLNFSLNSKSLFNKDTFEILKYKIITMSKEKLRNIYGITEGLENKIQSEIIDSYTYEDFIFKLKSKRYELSKIKRMLIHILLDTTKEDFENLK